MTNRYSVSDNEDFEPGSDNSVLKNNMGIKDLSIIQQFEARELLRAEQDFIKIFNAESTFTANDICSMHKHWLSSIYPFAGKYRTVNMSKGGFPFAGAPYIAKAMNEFEREYLSKFTPCHFAELSDLAHALAVVHIEFIIIHPFREGNGRIGRIIAILMALQAGAPPLNFRAIDQTIFPEGYGNYILAIHAGVDKNYEPMQGIFKKILEQSMP